VEGDVEPPGAVGRPGAGGGLLTGEEFSQLLALVRTWHPRAGSDVLGRLRAGGAGRYSRGRRRAPDCRNADSVGSAGRSAMRRRGGLGPGLHGLGVSAKEQKGHGFRTYSRETHPHLPSGRKNRCRSSRGRLPSHHHAHQGPARPDGTQR
jgi:hypothetical protein